MKGLIILAACFLLILAGCGGPNVAGEYKVTNREFGTELTYVLILRDNGNWVMPALDEFDDEELGTYKVVGDSVVLYDDGGKVRSELTIKGANLEDSFLGTFYRQ